MLNIIDERVQKYLDDLSSDNDPLLDRLEKRAHTSDFPIVDRQVGRLLHLLAMITAPRLVVELGSGFGYSAYCFATAMDKGEVVLTDYDQSHLDAAQAIFEEAGILEKGVFLQGDAVQSASRYHDIDILFLDLEKERYLESVQAMLPHIRKGGLVIADNTLWFGKVAEPDPDEETRGILAFNEYMFHSGHFYPVDLPVRDGVVVAVKVSD